MFRKYKCTVEDFLINDMSFSSRSQLDDNYSRILEEIKNANEDLDQSSQKFYDSIAHFPKLEIVKQDCCETFPLTKNVVGMLNLEVTLGHKTLKFLIDTGAQVSCINSKLIHNTHSLTAVEVNDASGHASVMNVTCVENIKTLGVEIRNLPMLVLNENQLGLNLFGNTILTIDGVLGWDVLRLIDFEIDYPKLKLQTFELSEFSGFVNFPTSDFPVVLVTDNTHSIRTFGLDLGARKSWINEKLIGLSALKSIQYKNKKNYGAHGSMTQRVHIVESYQLYLGSHRISFNNVATGYTKFLNDYELDGVLGLDICYNHKIVFINSKGILELK